MIDTSKGIAGDIAGVSTPGILKSSDKKTAANTLEGYRIRVDRFDLGPDMDDAYKLESLYTRSIDGSQDIVFLEEKTFTDKDTMTIIVKYMERKLQEDPAELLKKLREE